MGSDRVIRRDEGERLARVSDGFTAARRPVTVFFSLSHSPQFTPLPSGVRCSLHGDERQDGSQRGAGLHCRGKVRPQQFATRGAIILFMRYANGIFELFQPVESSLTQQYLNQWDLPVFVRYSDVSCSICLLQKVTQSALLRLKPFILRPGLLKKKKKSMCLFYVNRATTALSSRDLKHRAVQHPNEPTFKIHEYIEAQKQKSGCCSYF